MPQEQRPRKEALGGRAEIAAGNPNNLLRWHFFMRSEYIPAPASVVSTLRREAYKYKDYAGLHFLRQLHKMTRTNQTYRPNRSFHFVRRPDRTGLDRSWNKLHEMR